MATLNSRDAGIAVNGSFAEAIGFVGQLISAGVVEVEGDLVEDVTALVSELGVSFARARLAAAAEIVAEYPEPTPAKRGGGGGGGYRKGGNSGGSTTSTDPASEKQVGLIERLLEEKEHSLDVDTSGLTKATASTTIEKLLALPDAE